MNESEMISRLRFRLRFPRWMRRLYDIVAGNLPAFVVGQIVGAIGATLAIAGFFVATILAK